MTATLRRAMRRRHPVTGEFLPLLGPPLGYNAHRIPGGSRGYVPLPMVVEHVGLAWSPLDADPSGASIGYALMIEKLEAGA